MNNQENHENNKEEQKAFIQQQEQNLTLGTKKIRGKRQIQHAQSSSLKQKQAKTGLGTPKTQNQSAREYVNRVKQNGAVLAMVEPFREANTDWFEGYDWVIRLNPDVLIRRGDWILQQMRNSSNDGIFIDHSYNCTDMVNHVNCGRKSIYTDFTAFRPKVANGTALVDAFDQGRAVQAERHAWMGFEHIILKHRVAWLPNVYKPHHRQAHVQGDDCDVIHDHTFDRYCPDYFDH